MKHKHPYLPITAENQKEMLESIAEKNIEGLFSDIPKEFRLQDKLDLPDSHTEEEVSRRLKELASKNIQAEPRSNFLGGGVYMHYIPAAVPALAKRSEFVTSYTSYQSEISQGMLQTLFEYQSMLAEILQIDVVNSSMYDMASALGEAARMTSRIKKKRERFLVPQYMNPNHLRVLETYVESTDIEVEKIQQDPESGLSILDDLKSRIDDDVAGVYIEIPSYFGVIENQVDEMSNIVHEAGSLLVAGVDILSMGLIRPPGDYDADIVIAEGQPLGSPASYGGPLLGIFGCKGKRGIIRQMPGRLVGLTRTKEQPYERGYVLTLVPREQHIRREKATSNICSNQALMAVTAAVYLSLLTSSGLEQMSETIAYNSKYAAERLNELDGVLAPAIGSSIWKEFVVQFEGVTAQGVHQALLRKGIHGGRQLAETFPELGENLLVCVTELHTKDDIDELVRTVEAYVAEEAE
ncbi:MAG: aminomethyl-transferring glycine dehydrogenase subunit GcvPA [Candidatus Thorarchaeota archaeon]